MRVSTRVAVLVLALGAFAPWGAPAWGEEERTPPPQPPFDIDKVETETVRLVLVDVLVLDKDDSTVAGLTAEDFVVHHEGRRVAIDTLDDYCDEGAAEPGVARLARDRPAVAPESGRGIVFALDYQHIDSNQRNEVFDHVRKWLLQEMAPGDEVMLAALTGGVRIEQPFTTDRESALQALRRIEHDVTLWNGNFFHANEIGWVGGVTSLLDVIEQKPGHKALVLYSNMRDVPLDLEFDKIAAQAAASRCAIYPVDAAGLTVDSRAEASRGGPRPLGGG